MSSESRSKGAALRAIIRPARIQRMEIVFSVSQEEDGGFAAECLDHDIFTQADTWNELRSNVQEAVIAYFFDQPKPTFIRLHFVRDEVFAVA
jgi:hypothetical protein